MSDRIMSKAIHVCMYNMSKLLCESKLYCILILIAIELNSRVHEIYVVSCTMEYKMSPWFFPFIMSQRMERIIVIIGFLVLISDAPFHDNNTMTIMIRSKRLAYSIGNIMYIIITAIFYILYIALICNVMFIKEVEWNTDWGKVFGTIANTELGSSFKTDVIVINSSIVNKLMPIEAMSIGMGMTLLVFVLLALIVYVVNIHTTRGYIGMMAAGFFVIPDYCLHGGWDAKWMKYLSICTWCDLRYIGKDNNVKNLPYIYVVTSSIILIVVCIAIIIIRERKREVDKNG